MGEGVFIFIYRNYVYMNHLILYLDLTPQCLYYKQTKDQQVGHLMETSTLIK